MAEFSVKGFSLFMLSDLLFDTQNGFAILFSARTPVSIMRHLENLDLQRCEVKVKLFYGQTQFSCGWL